MEQHDLRKLIDACRTSRGDLELDELRPLAEALEQDPVLADHFARSQRLDDLLREAIVDVPVPSSLEHRLLAAVARNDASNVAHNDASNVAHNDGEPELIALRDGRVQQVGQPSGEQAMGEQAPTPVGLPTDPVLPQPDRTGTSGRILSRRGLWTLAASVSAAALLLVGVWWMAAGRSTLSEEGLVARIQVLTRQLRADDLEWHHVRVAEPPQGHPLGQAVRGATGRWTKLAALDDSQAVAYELGSRGDLPAVLFVVRTRLDCGLSPLPYRRLSTAGVTSGWTIAAWQSGDLLYVLVVPGEGQSLDAYVRAAQAA